MASDGAAGDGLGGGYGLAIDGDTVVAGAYTKPASGAGVVNTGAAYTFDATATGAATQTDKLLASDGAALDQFGFSVDIDGETIVVGANRDSFPGRNYVGSAYTFESTGAHTQTSKLVTSDGKSEDRVGWGVAAGGAQIAVAADLDDHGTSVANEGSVYLYPRSSPKGNGPRLRGSPRPTGGARQLRLCRRHGRHHVDRRRAQRRRRRERRSGLGDDLLRPRDRARLLGQRRQRRRRQGRLPG